MRVCLLSKYGQSSNWLYEGTRSGLTEDSIEFLDISISYERKVESPHWKSIPTLIQQSRLAQDEGICKEIVTFAPDVILLLQYAGLQFLLDNGEFLRKQLPQTKICFWLVDLEEEIFENKKLGSFIDFFFLSNGEQIEEYKKKWRVEQVIFMPQGAFVAPKFPVLQQRVQDLAFLGRRQQDEPRYQERNKLLDELKNNVGLVETNDLLDRIHIFDFYQKSKILLSTSWKNDGYLYSSDRIFNVLGAGTMALASYFPGIEKLFTNKKHLVWFTNVSEGISLAQYYLQHAEERETIARNGYDLIQEKHTYKKRVENILHILTHTSSDFEGFI